MTTTTTMTTPPKRPALERRSSLMNTVNPLQYDETLSEMLNNLSIIKDYDAFDSWRGSFLGHFEEFLGNGSDQAARDAYANFQSVMDDMVESLSAVTTYYNNGQISRYNGVSVKARHALNQLHILMVQARQEISNLAPATAKDAKHCGYSKFHVGAVLIRDEFQEYERLNMCVDILIVLDDMILEDIASKHFQSDMMAFRGAILQFCDLMEDLGLYRVIMKSRLWRQPVHKAVVIPCPPPEEESDSSDSDSDSECHQDQSRTTGDDNAGDNANDNDDDHDESEYQAEEYEQELASHQSQHDEASEASEHSQDDDSGSGSDDESVQEQEETDQPPIQQPQQDDDDNDTDQKDGSSQQQEQPPQTVPPQQAAEKETPVGKHTPGDNSVSTAATSTSATSSNDGILNDSISSSTSLHKPASTIATMAITPKQDHSEHSHHQESPKQDEQEQQQEETKTPSEQSDDHSPLHLHGMLDSQQRGTKPTSLPTHNPLHDDNNNDHDDDINSGCSDNEDEFASFDDEDDDIHVPDEDDLPLKAPDEPTKTESSGLVKMERRRRPKTHLNEWESIFSSTSPHGGKKKIVKKEKPKKRRSLNRATKQKKAALRAIHTNSGHATRSLLLEESDSKKEDIISTKTASKTKKKKSSKKKSSKSKDKDKSKDGLPKESTHSVDSVLPKGSTHSIDSVSVTTGEKKTKKKKKKEKSKKPSSKRNVTDEESVVSTSTRSSTRKGRSSKSKSSRSLLPEVEEGTEPLKPEKKVRNKKTKTVIKTTRSSSVTARLDRRPKKIEGKPPRKTSDHSNHSGHSRSSRKARLAKKSREKLRPRRQETLSRRRGSYLMKDESAEKALRRLKIKELLAKGSNEQ